MDGKSEKSWLKRDEIERKEQNIKEKCNIIAGLLVLAYKQNTKKKNAKV